MTDTLCKELAMTDTLNKESEIFAHIDSSINEDIGSSTNEVKDTGSSTNEVKDTGSSTNEVKDTGSSTNEVKDTGSSTNEVKDTAKKMDILDMLTPIFDINADYEKPVILNDTYVMCPINFLRKNLSSITEFIAVCDNIDKYPQLIKLISEKFNLVKFSVSCINSNYKWFCTYAMFNSLLNKILYENGKLYFSNDEITHAILVDGDSFLFKNYAHIDRKTLEYDVEYTSEEQKTQFCLCFGHQVYRTVSTLEEALKLQKEALVKRLQLTLVYPKKEIHVMASSSSSTTSSESSASSTSSSKSSTLIEPLINLAITE
jgi:hypothetical protein